MKKTITLVLLALTSQLSAQRVSYKTTHDDPMTIKKLQVDVAGIAGIGVGLEDNQQGYAAFGYEIGASYFPLLNKIEVRANFQKTEDLIDGNAYTKLELTGTYVLNSKTKKDKRSLILSRSSNGYTTTTKSIQTPQTRQSNFEAKGGIVFNNGSLGYLKPDPKTFAGSHSITYNSKGIIAGLQFRTFQNYAATINNKYTVKSSTHVLIYGDVMFMPVGGYKMRAWPTQEVVKIDKPTKTLLKEENITTPLGGKVGIRYANNRHKLFSYYVGSEIGILAPNKVIHGSFLVGLNLNFM